MQRLKNLAVPSLIIALLVFPFTTSSHNQGSPNARPLESAQGSRPLQTKFVKRKDAIPNRYIVMLNDDVVSDDSPREVRLERVREIANEHALVHAGRTEQLYETAVKGYAIELPNEAVARAISNRPEVKWVEEDYSLTPEQTPPSPQPTPPWGLDSIDGSYPLVGPNAPNNSTGRTNGIYQFSGTGAGVNAYVIDSGINTAHVDFQTGFGTSRAVQAADCILHNDCRTGQASQFVEGPCAPGMPNAINNDCFGHGTYVAGILGGNTYGVAKGVSIRSIKACVVPNATTSFLQCPASVVIAGVNWVTSEHQTSSAVPKVVNMSLGYPNTAPNPPLFDNNTLDNAVANSISNGVTYVIAAGNSNVDARTFHPASVTTAITVGAVDWNGNRWVASASDGSNYGPVLDIFAPGVNIVSALTGNQMPCLWNGTNNSECRSSGTSAAAPHVAGAVAMYLQNRTGLNNCTFPILGPAPPLNANLSTCPDRIERYFKANANRDVLNSSIHVTVTGPNGLPLTIFSPNKFLWNISVPTLPNPLENHRFFVWSQYEDILGREPDSGGFNNWLVHLNSCLGSDWNCINEARIDIVRGFIESFEFRQGKQELSNPNSTAQYNEFYVRWLYRTLLRREADPVGLSNYVNHLNSTGDYDHAVRNIINAAEYRVRFGPQ